LIVNGIVKNVRSAYQSGERERERLQTRGKVKDSTEARPVPEYSMLFDFLTPIPGISF